jgi:DNA-binding response OmpR family regulator
MTAASEAVADPEIRAMVLEGLSGLDKAFGAAFRRAKDKGELPEGADPAVLAQLARFPGRVITHNQIMNEVWPHEHEHHVEYLRVLVRTLRQKLEADPQQPRIICNELGIGYRLRLAGDNLAA